VLGLDIGSHSVKAVELSQKGDRLALTGFGRAAIETPDHIDETIKELIQEQGLKNKRVITAVSGRSVIVRYISMMAMQPEELRQAISYEADKYIPFEVDEVVLDCQRLDDIEAEGGAESGQMKVLLVAVKRTLIDEHIELLDKVGLTPVIIDVDVFALGNAFELFNLYGEPLPEDKVYALVDIGNSKTSINIMKGSSSYFTREIYIAGDDITEAVARRFGEDRVEVEKMKVDPGDAIESMREAIMPALEDLGSEIRLSFDYYENQFDQQVAEVFVSGGSVKFSGMDAALTEIFGLKTTLWSPLERLEILDDRLSAEALQEDASDLAIAVGLASRLRRAQ